MGAVQLETLYASGHIKVPEMGLILHCLWFSRLLKMQHMLLGIYGLSWTFGSSYVALQNPNLLRMLGHYGFRTIRYANEDIPSIPSIEAFGCYDVKRVYFYELRRSSPEICNVREY
jgi:hypothetical protein